LLSCKAYFAEQSDLSILPPAKKQKCIDFAKASEKAVDLKLAMTIFATARPFTLFEDPVFLDFINAVDARYHPPSATTISNSLLPQCYNRVRNEVMTEINKLRYINLCVDETTNIRGQRILNLSISTPECSYYITSEDMADQNLNAPTIASWIVSKLAELLGPSTNWKKINSFTSDTCNLMKAVWAILASTEGLEHVFYIPCDSHSLQLVIKDLLSLPR
jgi:uncharacterized protein DUF659